MTSKLKFIFLILVCVAISLVFGTYIRAGVVDIGGGILRGFYTAQNFIKESISEHFDQKREIERLREENKELRKSAVLLSTFANELDQVLVDKNSTRYEPNVQLVKTLSYATIGDYNKFWVDFKGFDTTKIYGALYQANTIGVIVTKDNRPLAVLQNDPKVAFSVYIGPERIPGVVGGDGRRVLVKYIPQWLEPKIGDEVTTSGLDGIFFAGVPVGRITSIEQEDLYKSAIVEPYAKPNIPAFLYVVTAAPHIEANATEANATDLNISR